MDLFLFLVKFYKYYFSFNQFFKHVQEEDRVKKNLYKIFGTAVFMFVIFTSINFAQTDESKAEEKCGLSFSYGADLVSRYIWRGVEYGAEIDGFSSPHFQPTAALSYNFGKGGALSLGVWGSYPFSGTYSESDVYLSYEVDTKVGNLSVTVYDYYYPYKNIPVTNFDGKAEGAHTIEASATFTMHESFPLSITVSNNVHNDIPDDKSLYLELGYPFKIGDTDLGVFAGAAKGQSAWHLVYTDKFEFINLGLKASKSVKITQDYSIPVGFDWIYNAHLKKTYIVFKVTL